MEVDNLNSLEKYVQLANSVDKNKEEIKYLTKQYKRHLLTKPFPLFLTRDSKEYRKTKKELQGKMLELEKDIQLKHEESVELELEIISKLDSGTLEITHHIENKKVKENIGNSLPSFSANYKYLLQYKFPNRYLNLDYGLNLESMSPKEFRDSFVQTVKDLMDNPYYFFIGYLKIKNQISKDGFYSSVTRYTPFKNNLQIREEQYKALNFLMVVSDFLSEFIEIDSSTFTFYKETKHNFMLEIFSAFENDIFLKKITQEEYVFTYSESELKKYFNSVFEHTLAIFDSAKFIEFTALDVLKNFNSYFDIISFSNKIDSAYLFCSVSKIHYISEIFKTIVDGDLSKDEVYSMGLLDDKVVSSVDSLTNVFKDALSIKLKSMKIEQPYSIREFNIKHNLIRTSIEDENTRKLKQRENEKNEIYLKVKSLKNLL